MHSTVIMVESMSATNSFFSRAPIGCTTTSMLPSMACSTRRTSAGRALTRMSAARSEEHTSELQTLIPISYTVCCFKKNTEHLHIVQRLSSQEIQNQLQVHYTKY